MDTVKRRTIDWYANDELRCVKAVAYAVWTHERPTPARLLARTRELFGPIAVEVFGVSLTFEAICAMTLEKFGTPITENKLAQRCDKVDRYGEFVCRESEVIAAYRRVVGA